MIVQAGLSIIGSVLLPGQISFGVCCWGLAPWSEVSLYLWVRTKKHVYSHVITVMACDNDNVPDVFCGAATRRTYWNLLPVTCTGWTLLMLTPDDTLGAMLSCWAINGLPNAPTYKTHNKHHHTKTSHPIKQVCCWKRSSLWHYPLAPTQSRKTSFMLVTISIHFKYQ